MWYRYNKFIINLKEIYCISKDDYNKIYFNNKNIEESVNIKFETKKESDSEFEKICKMLGLEEKQITRCC